MILLKPTMVDLLTLCGDARPDEIEQYEVLMGRRWDVDDMANDLYNRAGVKFSLYTNDCEKLIVVGGWEPAAPGVWQSWMVGTDASWNTHWRSITKATRKVMDTLLEGDARRLQTMALASRTKACEWYERGLLMEREGILRSFGANGEDVVIYSRLRDTIALQEAA